MRRRTLAVLGLLAGLIAPTVHTCSLQPAGNATFPAGCFQLVRDSITSADANLSSGSKLSNVSK